MAQQNVPISNSELQALIAAIPNDLAIVSSASGSSKSNCSLGELSTSASSSSCVFPTIHDMTALSMLSLPTFPLLGGFPLISPMQLTPFGAAALPPHATIESLGLINSHLYHQQQRGALSATSSPAPEPIATSSDTRPRAYSSAATLQHPKSETRRKRARRANPEPATPPKPVSPCGMPQPHSVLRSLVEDDDVTPMKVRPIQVTREEEEFVRRKTAQLLERVPVVPESDEEDANNNSNRHRRPLRQLIRDQDLPDEVGPDSPFRHYPKYQHLQRQRREQQQQSQLRTIQGIQAAVATLCIEAIKSEQGKNAVEAPPTPRTDNSALRKEIAATD
ncbi:unnamed protein product [Caenorhabditis auriculariae]|uniref:Uncharacterized protein n=1 Tax=Caenorhabditis auriculariae TaxID=2777116 RepID=A0A8S1H4F6_9PELO|nr:unnamed protein product [Caenorhabditis auriculariae]